jgi:hypothetical protein
LYVEGCDLTRRRGDAEEDAERTQKTNATRENAEEAEKSVERWRWLLQ